MIYLQLILTRQQNQMVSLEAEKLLQPSPQMPGNNN